MTIHAPPTPPIKRRRITRRRIFIGMGALFLIVLVGLNTIAYVQAHSMTHFADGGVRTPPPEGLSKLGKVGILFTGVRMPRPENKVTPNLPYQTVRFGGATKDDCEGWYIPCENSKGMVLLFPAYVASKSAQLEQAYKFHAMGYDLLMVDFRGTGGSKGNETAIGYREAEDVLAACNFAQARWPQKQILYGQSMGAAAILRAVGKLNVQPSAVIIESCFDRLLATCEDRFNSMGMPSFPLAELLVFWGGEQEGFNGFRHNPADYAANVHCPVLMLHASRDSRVTEEQAQNLFKHLAGPKQFELFKDSWHCTFLKDDPARWTRVIESFLQHNS